jgi:hypothetical protein
MSRYLQQTRRRSFCSGCEAGVPHDCDAYDDIEDEEDDR